MLIPQVYITQKQSPREIMKDFNAWACKRAEHVKALEAKDAEDSLGIPSETHVQWDQGLQHYIMTVVYLATKEEIESAANSGVKS
jgi:hypothetical protein